MKSQKIKTIYLFCILMIFCSYIKAYGILVGIRYTGNAGFISKETIQNSDLICIGRVKKIIMEKANITLSKKVIYSKNFIFHLNQDKTQIVIYPKDIQLKKQLQFKEIGV